MERECHICYFYNQIFSIFHFHLLLERSFMRDQPRSLISRDADCRITNFHKVQPPYFLLPLSSLLLLFESLILGGSALSRWISDCKGRKSGLPLFITQLYLPGTSTLDILMEEMIFSLWSYPWCIKAVHLLHNLITIYQGHMIRKFPDLISPFCGQIPCHLLIPKMVLILCI